MSAPTWAPLLIPIALFMTQTIGSAAPALQLRDVEYAQSAGLSLRFDASIPAVNSAPVPAAIIVHGGGWVRGDRRSNVEPLFKPLADAGFAWFSISYTLAANPIMIGSAVSDVEAAISFIRSHAAEYRIDPERIFLVGESAGGQLAAMAALGTAAGTHVKALVAIYTPTDLVALARTSTLIPDGVRRQINGTPFEKLILARLGQLSPILAVRKDMPPVLFIHGDADQVVPIDQSQAMCARMKVVGASCQLFTVPGGGHGIRWWESVPQRSEPYKREMVRWLQEQFSVVRL